MNELALFAGAGGGILGGKLLGWRTLCAVEIDPYAASVLIQRQNDGILPPFPIWDDICTFDGRPWRGRIDVVSGGFPCQDISIAGKGAGIEGERSGLWREMARIIREVQPRYAFIENSPMLIVRGLDVVLCDLAEMGYDAKWGIIGGSAIGNICEGERVWIVAFKADCAMLESVDVSQYIEPYSEESCRRQYTRAVSKMLSQDDYCAVKRNPNEVSRQMDRLRAIGNAQIPGVAALAWEILSNAN